MKPDHIHKFVEQEQGPGGNGSLAAMLAANTPRNVTIVCYQRDCYHGGSYLDRGMYPPEKIGPKLVVLEE